MGNTAVENCGRIGWLDLITVLAVSFVGAGFGVWAGKHYGGGYYSYTVCGFVLGGIGGFGVSFIYMRRIYGMLVNNGFRFVSKFAGSTLTSIVFSMFSLLFMLFYISGICMHILYKPSGFIISCIPSGVETAGFYGSVAALAAGVLAMVFNFKAGGVKKGFKSINDWAGGTFTAVICGVLCTLFLHFGLMFITAVVRCIHGGGFYFRYSPEVVITGVRVGIVAALVAGGVLTALYLITDVVLKKHLTVMGVES